MAALLMGETPGDIPSAPLPPPPPPLPPRRKVSEPRHYPVFTPIPLPPRNVPRKQTINVCYMELKKSPTFYLKLASTVLKFLSSIIQSESERLQAFVKESIRVEHISGLAWLVQNLENSIAASRETAEGDGNANAKDKAAVAFTDEVQSFARDVHAMVHEMVMSGVVGEQLHGVFLRELGLVTKCWPLHIPLSSLSLLGRVLVCRLQCRAMEDVQGDDPLAHNIWKGCVGAMKEKLLGYVIALAVLFLH